MYKVPRLTTEQAQGAEFDNARIITRSRNQPHGHNVVCLTSSRRHNVPSLTINAVKRLRGVNVVGSTMGWQPNPRNVPTLIRRVVRLKFMYGICVVRVLH